MDIAFDFSNAPPSTRFGAGDSVRYTVSGIASLTANSFAFTNVGSNRALLSSAHVQGIAPNGDNSGWVTVPEPATLGAAGLIAASAMLRRRRSA
jgi:hypothetical protein